MPVYYCFSCRNTLPSLNAKCPCGGGSIVYSDKDEVILDELDFTLSCICGSSKFDYVDAEIKEGEGDNDVELYDFEYLKCLGCGKYIVLCYNDPKLG